VYNQLLKWILLHKHETSHKLHCLAIVIREKEQQDNHSSQLCGPELLFITVSYPYILVTQRKPNTFTVIWGYTP